MQEKLGTLATQLDAIIRRIRTLGLTRAADDLLRVSAQLRELGHASPARSNEGGTDDAVAGNGRGP